MGVSEEERASLAGSLEPDERADNSLQTRRGQRSISLRSRPDDFRTPSPPLPSPLSEPSSDTMLQSQSLQPTSLPGSRPASSLSDSFEGAAAHHFFPSRTAHTQHRPSISQLAAAAADLKHQQRRAEEAVTDSPASTPSGGLREDQHWVMESPKLHGHRTLYPGFEGRPHLEPQGPIPPRSTGTKEQDDTLNTAAKLDKKGGEEEGAEATVQSNTTARDFAFGGLGGPETHDKPPVSTELSSGTGDRTLVSSWDPDSSEDEQPGASAGGN